MAESMSCFFECIQQPQLYYSSSCLIVNLLEAELGGNCIMRWIGIMEQEKVESESSFFLYRLLEQARNIPNNAVISDIPMKKLQTRTRLKFSHSSSTTPSTPSTTTIQTRIQQREKDLISRINNLIQASSAMQDQVGAAKKAALESKKKLLDAQIETSRVHDDLESALYTVHHLDFSLMYRVCID